MRQVRSAPSCLRHELLGISRDSKPHWRWRTSLLRNQWHHGVLLRHWRHGRWAERRVESVLLLYTLSTSWRGYQSWRQEGVDSSLLWKLLLWWTERALKARRLLLNRRELLRSWIRKRARPVVHVVRKVLLGNACLHGILETVEHAGVLILHVLRLRHHPHVLLRILSKVLLLTYHSHILLGILGSIEACILLLQSYIIQALAWGRNPGLESSRRLHPCRLRLQRRKRECTLLIGLGCRQRP